MLWSAKKKKKMEGGREGNNNYFLHSSVNLLDNQLSIIE